MVVLNDWISKAIKNGMCKYDYYFVRYIPCPVYPPYSKEEYFLERK